jgi:hypothetical protein
MDDDLVDEAALFGDDDDGFDELPQPPKAASPEDWSDGEEEEEEAGAAAVSTWRAIAARAVAASAAGGGGAEEDGGAVEGGEEERGEDEGSGEDEDEVPSMVPRVGQRITISGGGEEVAGVVVLFKEDDVVCLFDDRGTAFARTPVTSQELTDVCVPHTETWDVLSISEFNRLAAPEPKRARPMGAIQGCFFERVVASNGKPSLMPSKHAYHQTLLPHSII